MFGSALLLGCMLLGQAQATTGEDLQLEVRRLVRQLGAARLAQREEAEQKLLEFGPKVLDLLPRLTERTPAEVRTRIGRIRFKLERTAAESSAKASLISLKGDAIRLSKVLAALQEQSGNKIVDFRTRFGQEVTDPPLKIDFDKTPFWPALDRVLDQAGLTAYPFGEENAVAVVARQANRPARGAVASYSGPFRIEPTRIVARRDLRDPDGRVLLLALEVSWEPRLKPIAVGQKLADLSAVDEQGNPLPPDDSTAELAASTESSTAAELILPMKLPPRSVEKIAQLKGRLRTVLPGRVETFTFDRLTEADDVEKRIGGATVILQRVRRNNEIWQVHVRVRFDQAGPALESHRGWIFDNPAYLEDPDGKQIEYDAFETTRQTKNEVGMAYGFVLDGPPTGYKFVYKTPVLIVDTGFDYKIENVELP